MLQQCQKCAQNKIKILPFRCKLAEFIAVAFKSSRLRHMESRQLNSRFRNVESRRSNAVPGDDWLAIHATVTGLSEHQKKWVQPKELQEAISQ